MVFPACSHLKCLYINLHIIDVVTCLWKPVGLSWDICYDSSERKRITSSDMLKGTYIHGNASKGI